MEAAQLPRVDGPDERIPLGVLPSRFEEWRAAHGLDHLEALSLLAVEIASQPEGGHCDAARLAERLGLKPARLGNGKVTVRSSITRRNAERITRAMGLNAHDFEEPDRPDIASLTGTWPTGRQCGGCDARLSIYNPGPLCRPCSNGAPPDDELRDGDLLTLLLQEDL